MAQGKAENTSSRGCRGGCRQGAEQQASTLMEEDVTWVPAGASARGSSANPRGESKGHFMATESVGVGSSNTDPTCPQGQGETNQESMPEQAGTTVSLGAIWTMAAKSLRKHFNVNTPPLRMFPASMTCPGKRSSSLSEHSVWSHALGHGQALL